MFFSALLNKVARASKRVLVLGLLAMPAAAFAVEPVTLMDGDTAVPLAGHIEVLREVDPAWTLDDVRKPDIAARFVASDRANFNFGYTTNATWLRMSLRNPSESKQTRWVLSLGLPVLDYIDLLLTRADGRTETTLLGDLRPKAANALDSNEFAIPVKLSAGESATVHVRVQNNAAQLIVVVLTPEPVYAERAVARHVSGGVLIGCFLALTLYNLLIWFWTRDRAYLFLGLSILSSACMQTVFSGYAREFLGANSETALHWINQSLAVFITTTPLGLLLVAREFLQTRQHAPRLDVVLRGLLAASALIVLLAPVLSYKWATLLGNVQFAIYSTFLPGVGYWLWRRGVRTAGFYLLATTAISMAYVGGVLIVIGVIKTNGLFLVVLPVLGAIGCVLLSLALADHMLVDRRERERFARLKDFFAPQVAEAILEEGGSSLLAPKRREVTVVFTDLRGFTAFAAQSEPEEVIRVLREYHEAVVEATAKHGGNVEHIAGDGVMAYFNAPVEVSEPESRAVRMGFELRQRFETLRQSWAKRGHELGVGIGMAVGYATVGAVGAKGRMDYSCIGTVTNLAARLCALARHGQILVPQQLLNRVESLVSAEPLGEQELKGMPKPVAVFNLEQARAA